FPRLVNKSLNFMVELQGKDAFGRETGLAIVPAPRALPRLVKLPAEVSTGGDHFAVLSSMMHAHAEGPFPGATGEGPSPSRLPRLVKLPDEVSTGGDQFVFLSSMIHAHAEELFPGMTVKGLYQFRITRNADLVLEHEEMEDLAAALRGELLSRRFGEAVRLEVADNCPEPLVQYLLEEYGLTEAECYRVNGPVNLTRLMALGQLIKRPDLH